MSGVTIRRTFNDRRGIGADRCADVGRSLIRVRDPDGQAVFLREVIIGRVREADGELTPADPLPDFGIVREDLEAICVQAFEIVPRERLTFFRHQRGDPGERRPFAGARNRELALPLGFCEIEDGPRDILSRTRFLLYKIIRARPEIPVHIPEVLLKSPGTAFVLGD